MTDKTQKIPTQFILLLIRDGCPILENDDYEPTEPMDNWNEKWGPTIDYYSTDKFRTSYELAVKAHTDLSMVDIDYDKCYDWQDGTEGGFTDSFHPDIMNNFITCVIVLKNGQEYKFAASIRKVSLFDLAMKMANSKVTLEEALDGLDRKIREYNKDEDKYQQVYFKYQKFEFCP